MYNQQHSLSDIPYTIIEGITNQSIIFNKDLVLSGSLTATILKYSCSRKRSYIKILLLKMFEMNLICKMSNKDVIL